MLERRLATEPERAARRLLRSTSASALLALLQTYALGPVPGSTGPAYAGCDALRLGDPETPPSVAEERCWSMALAFLELEGLTGLESQAVDVWDDTLQIARKERLARLTDEGQRQAMEVLERWAADDLPTAGRSLRADASHCSQALMRLARPEGGPARTLVDHGSELLLEVRPLVELLDASAEDPAARPRIDATWAHVHGRAAGHAEAIMTALGRIGDSTPKDLGEFALEVLSLAHRLGVDLDAPEGVACHA